MHGAITDPVGTNLIEESGQARAISLVSTGARRVKAKQQLELIKIDSDVNYPVHSAHRGEEQLQARKRVQLAEEAGYKVEEYSVPSTNGSFNHECGGRS